MSEDKIYLFTTSRCPKCPIAKQYVIDSGLEEKVDIIVADQSAEGMALAREYGVAMVPTFVVNGKQYSLDEFKELNENE